MCVLPDEVGAVAAEGRLLEEAGRELMVFHLHNPLVFERSLPLEDRHPGRRGEGRRQRGGCRRGRDQGQRRQRRGGGDWCGHDAWRIQNRQEGGRRDDEYQRRGHKVAQARP